MKSKQVRKIFLSTVCVWILLSLFSSKAYASGNTIEVIIPVIQDFYVQSDSAVPPEQIGKYELYSKEPDSPMPEGSKNGRFEFSINGNNVNKEIRLLGNRAGVYHYTLRQVTEDADNYTYDRTSYAITLYIENAADNRFSSQVIVENGQAGKCAEIRFQNHYKNSDGPVQPPAMGDQSNILFYKLICLSSFIGLVALTVIRKKAAS